METFEPTTEELELWCQGGYARNCAIHRYRDRQKHTLSLTMIVDLFEAQTGHIMNHKIKKHMVDIVACFDILDTSCKTGLQKFTWGMLITDSNLLTVEEANECCKHVINKYRLEPTVEVINGLRIFKVPV